MVKLPKPIKFVWDKGNSNKNWAKHRVSDAECEESFFDKHKKIFTDVVHSQKEKRHRVIGKTRKNRMLFMVFTIRDHHIRIISARDINKKEVYLYEEKA